MVYIRFPLQQYQSLELLHGPQHHQRRALNTEYYVKKGGKLTFTADPQLGAERRAPALGGRGGGGRRVSGSNYVLLNTVGTLPGVPGGDVFRVCLGVGEQRQTVLPYQQLDPAPVQPKPQP